GVPADSELAAGSFEIRDPTAAAALGIDPPTLRARTSGWSGRRLPAITITYLVKQRELVRASAPNVIGVLEGSDPKLKGEYVFFTGHMDHIGTPGVGEGCVAQGADSICNGADDDASGTTAVIETAAAFAKLAPHPRRSLAFMTVSGEERGLWGSQFFSEHPTVPLTNVVADLNSDMVGRNWKDTIVVIGKEHSNLGATLNRVASAHPELRQQHVHRLLRREPHEAPPEFLFRLHRGGIGEQLLAPSTARGVVDGRIDPPVGELAGEAQFGVAGALELLEDHVVHAALSL